MGWISLNSRCIKFTSGIKVQQIKNLNNGEGGI